MRPLEYTVEPAEAPSMYMFIAPVVESYVPAAWCHAMSAYDPVVIVPPKTPDALLIFMKTFPALSMPKCHDAPPYAVVDPVVPPVTHLEIKNPGVTEVDAVLNQHSTVM
jgi:hypothetical protein